MHPIIKATALGCAATLLAACGSENNKQAGTEEIDVEARLASATTLEQYLKKGYIDRYSYSGYDTETGTTTAIDVGAVDESAESDADSSDYSATNTQEDGVDEADLIKQNGDYLYAVRNPGYWQNDSNGAAILTWSTATGPTSSQLQSTIALDDATYVHGLYLTDNNLIALTRGGVDPVEYYYDDSISIDEQTSTASSSAWYYQSYITNLKLLSLNDPTTPTLSLQISFEGYMVSSRVVGNQLYLANRFTPQLDTPSYYSDVSTSDWQQTVLDTPLEDLLPRVWVNGELQGHLFEDGDCNVPDLAQGGYPSLTAVIRINLDDPTDWQASCNSGRLYGVYASTDAFVLTGYNDASYDSTRLDWYDLANFELIASSSVPGTLDGNMPSFRLSEQNGYLRVLTSSWNWGFWDTVEIDDVAAVEVDNAAAASSSDTTTSTTVISSEDWQHRLFVLQAADDGSLDLISQLPNSERTTVIGKPGEDVKSVRYFNQRAYVVTFQQTDPLYVINLSDNSDPFVEGELEITVGPETRTLKAGDAYLFNSKEPHRFKNNSDRVCKVISACTPPYL